MSESPPRGSHADAAPNAASRFRRWFGSLPLSSKLVLVAGLVTLLVVVGSLVAPSGKSSERVRPRVERGVACPHLRTAARNQQAGDDRGFRRSVFAAAAAGERSLERDGQVFGAPEEIAIELRYIVSEGTPREQAEIGGYLEQARAACVRLGRWS